MQGLLVTFSIVLLNWQFFSFWFYSLCINFQIFISSVRSSYSDNGLLYIRGSSGNFFRFWAFKHFYNVTSVTLGHLNSINAIDVIRCLGYLGTIFGTILGLSWDYLGTILGLSLGLSWDYLGTILGLSWDYLETILGLLIVVFPADGQQERFVLPGC